LNILNGLIVKKGVGLMAWCELCEEDHLELRKELTTIEFEGKVIEYCKEYCYCPVLDEKFFIAGQLDSNLAKIRKKL
jgi:hypothetical protein